MDAQFSHVRIISDPDLKLRATNKTIDYLPVTELLNEV